MRTRSLLLFLVITLSPCVTRAQTTTASKDTTAVALLSQAVNVLSQAVPVNSITLTATATRTAGSDVETGTATLEALSGEASRVSLALTDGQQSETINQSQAAPGGQWSGTDGSVHPMALHNSMIPASWFFPALALAQAINDPSISITYIGQETLDGEVVQRVRFWRILRGEAGTPEDLARFHDLSAADVYLDASNSLPVELDFNLHPDNNLSVDIPAEIQYSGYQKIGGILLPARIQKSLNHSVILDLNVTGAAVNTNLSPADFAVAATATGN